jgi:Putative DNA-binding domain
LRIDDELIERLLYEEESDALDFKRDQYPFVKATNEQKSELIKDILAFANSWRRTDAFIVIGVLEVKGGRSAVVGVSDQLDDAAIQQFVNSKTNSFVSFSYRNLTFEGKSIAIIHIPLQQRPLFLKKNFGRLKANAVYVKRGSSTTEADPDEVAKMGNLPELRRGRPELEVFFADPKSRTRLASKQVINCICLRVPDASGLPDYSERHDMFDLQGTPNRDYYRKLVHYTIVSQLTVPVHFGVYNSGDAPAQDVRIEIEVSKNNNGIVMMNEWDFPEIPKTRNDLFAGARLHSKLGPLGDREAVGVRDVGAAWLIEAETEKVHSKAHQWFENSVYIGGYESGEIEMEVKIFADELNDPQEQKLVIEMNVERREVDLIGILEMERERRARSRGGD